MSIAFIITFVFCLALLGVFTKYAGQIGFEDTPNFRSSHKQTTPSGSGIAIFTAVFVVSLFTDLGSYENYKNTLGAITLVLLLGVFDDLKSFRARNKLIIIVAAAIFSSLDGLIVTNIGTYFGYTVSLAWLAVPFTIVAITGFTNAFNLIDGLDGLAGTISIILLGALWFIGFDNNDYIMVSISSLTISAVLAFLIYNWNPAKVFMGDSGSLTLGFVISILSIKAMDYINPVVILYIVAFPLIDALVIIVRRRKYQRSVFLPDKNHAHHVLLNLYNGNVKKAVMVIALIQLAYTLFGIFAVRTLPQEITLPFFVINVIFWYFVLTRRCENHSRLLMERQSV